MCLIFVGWRTHPGYRLVVAANRDEYHHRPTAAARFWDDAPEVLAGRDLAAHGTWLGVTRCGRFAAITNFRDPARQRPDAPSRGDLVADFLRGAERPADYLAALRHRDADFNGFSLLVSDGAELAFHSNRDPRAAVSELSPGVYGLSNHLLDTPWPKVVRGRRSFESLLRGSEPDVEGLLSMLRDERPAPAGTLPDTGVGPEREVGYSPIFVSMGEYGTRSSTVVAIAESGQVVLVERSYDGDGRRTGEARHEFEIAGEARLRQPA